MRKNTLLSLLVFVTFFLGCTSESKNSEVVVNPVLDGIISLYMESHDSKLYSLNFYEMGGRMLFNILESKNYSPDFMDGYFYYKGKVVLYCKYNCICIDELIDEQMAFKAQDSIPNVKTDKSIVYCEDPDIRLYEFFQDGNIEEIKDDESDKKWNYPVARDVNVIKSNTLNSILNAFINRTNGLLYELRFSNIYGHDYVSLRQAKSYDADSIQGYFHRNGYTIILYGLNNLHSDMVDGRQVEKYSGSVDCFKSHHEKYWHALKVSYRIISKEQLEQVDHEDSLWIKI